MRKMSKNNKAKRSHSSSNRNKSKKRNEPRLYDTDQEVADYISGLKLRRTLFGIAEEEMWIIISNIHRHYAMKEREHNIHIMTLEDQLDEKNRRLAKFEMLADALRRKYEAGSVR